MRNTLIMFVMFLTTTAFSQEPYVGEVIGWKFNHAPGISTRDGVITAFPKVAVDRDENTRDNTTLPTDEELTQWKAEYVAWKAAQAVVKTDSQKVQDEIDNLKLLLAAVGTAALGAAGYAAATRKKD